MFTRQDPQFVVVHIILKANGTALIWVALLKLVERELLEGAGREAVAAGPTVVPDTLHNLCTTGMFGCYQCPRLGISPVLVASRDNIEKVL